jgi:ATP adenylyltransferase
VSLERLWAGWRAPYVADAGPGDRADDGCVLCRLLAGEGDDAAVYRVWRGQRTAAVLNAFPYTSGHVMVGPTRHVGDLEDLQAAEGADLWGAVTSAVHAIKAAYQPGGVNVGLNLGRAAGAGVPGHLHVHVLPRWEGDTNFMTTAAEVRVLPEALPDSYAKLRQAWPR